MQQVRSQGGDERSQAVCEVPVSTLYLARNRSISYPFTSEPPSTVSVSLDTRYLQTDAEPPPRPDLQSKQCQKAHWKALHKTTCTTQATIRENLRETPKEKERSKKITSWMNIWTNTIAACAPIALDLANHEWGYHDTHRCVLSAVPVCPFLLDPDEKVSSCVWNPPVSRRNANCLRLGNPHTTQPLLTVACFYCR